MEEIKKEVLDLRDSNISKLNIKRGEDLTELYVQNNALTEIDLTDNKKLRIVDCTGNPLKYIDANAPGDEEGRFPLRLAAGRGGSVGLRLEPGLQEYHAKAEDGYVFDGWYDELGDRLSKEAVWQDEYGASRNIVAWFIKQEG